MYIAFMHLNIYDEVVEMFLIKDKCLIIFHLII